MADSTLDLVMSLQDNKVTTGLDAMARKEDDVAKAAAKIAREAKKADDELKRFGDRTTAINSTPLEKYNAQLAKLDQALKRGTISQETYNRAVSRARTELNSTGAAAQQATAPNLIAGITTVGLAWQAVSKSLALVNEGLAYAEARTNRAVDAVASRLNTTIDLNTIGGPELVARSNALTKHGLTKAEADAITIKAQNEGFLPDLEYLAKHKAGVGDLTAMGSVAGSFPDMFSGVTAREAVNIVGATAQYSKLSPAEMAPLMQTAAGGAREAGTSVHELGAAMAVLSQVNDPGKLATQLQTWSIKQGQSAELKGKGLFGGLAALDAMSEEERSEFLKGDIQTRKLYADFSNPQLRVQLAPMLAQIQAAERDTGGANDWLQMTTARNLTNPQIAAPLSLIAAQEAQKLAEESQLAGGGAQVKTTRANFMASLARQGASGLKAFAADKAMGVAESLGFGPSRIQTAGEFGGVAYEGASRGPGYAASKLDPTGGALVRVLESAAKHLENASARLERAAAKTHARNVQAEALMHAQ